MDLTDTILITITLKTTRTKRVPHVCYIRFALIANRCSLNNQVLISGGLRGTSRKHWQFHSYASWWQEAYWIYTVNSLKPNGLNETLDISPSFKYQECRPVSLTHFVSLFLQVIYVGKVKPLKPLLAQLPALPSLTISSTYDLLFLLGCIITFVL